MNYNVKDFSDWLEENYKMTYLNWQYCGELVKQNIFNKFVKTCEEMDVV